MFYMSHISWFEWLTLSRDIHDFIDEAKSHQSIHNFENTWKKPKRPIFSAVNVEELE